MLDRRTINVLLTTLVFILAVALVYVVRTILVLFAFSILFAYLTILRSESCSGTPRSSKI